MEGRPSRGRGGGWKRGGRAAGDSDGFGGEHRGRGRGGQHRGRGKRDHHRGRGRGGGGRAAEFYHRDEEGNDFEEGDDRTEVFSRRKLESNWDRYEDSEKQEAEDDAPAQRGTDFQVLLESAGDSFTQFRFSEEKDWTMDSFTATRMSAVLLDLPALAERLQQVPLHQRLNLEAELVQVSAPVELPVVTIAPKQEILKTSTFTAPESRQGSQQAAPAPGQPVQEAATDDCDEELNQLLRLQKPAAASPAEPAAEETVEEVCDETEDEVKAEDVASPKPAGVRQEVTDEDLEDWLDSMIS
ncbi:cell death regulator Aven [Betta splendens]|uniref:Cell death regulator Aven n=1 Tax=Betta splendens TaxID=158456 RepID=A0A6P7LSK6_BETSP|nr:cell death regulator Aven [Betta splendens]